MAGWRQDQPAGRAEPGAVPRWRLTLASLLDLPPDLVSDLPRLTLIGQVQLTVENHAGIRFFSSEVVGIRTATGVVRVRGEDLRICSLQRQEVRVTGTVHAVDFLGSEEP